MLAEDGEPFSLEVGETLIFEDEGEDACPRCRGGATGAVRVDDALPRRGLESGGLWGSEVALVRAR